jgi:DNA repair protein RadD
VKPPELRDYQQTGVDGIRKALASGNDGVCFVLSTGGGKTVTFSYIAHGAASKGKTIVIMAHRKELCRQISNTLAQFGVVHHVIAAPQAIRSIKIEQFKAHRRSFVSSKIEPVIVASVQTLAKRLDSLPIRPDIIVCDEGHHLTQGSQWGKVVEHYPDAKLLAVTATPCRLDGKGLGRGHGGYMDAMVFGPSMGELIERGYLSPYRIFAPPTALDLSNVKTRMGDYAKDDLAEAMDKPTITGSAVEHYRMLANGKRAVVFCVGVAHAEHVASQFRDAGFSAAHVDGGMDDALRDKTLSDFSEGRISILTSSDLISEGFDVPGIEVAIMLRPTQSLSLYLQQIGRALRYVPGKTAIILDHVGVVAKHGLPDSEFEWSLEGQKKRKKKPSDEDEVKVKTCTQCFATFAPQPICPNCGHKEEAKARQLEETDGKLVEITEEQKQQMRKQQRKEEGMAKTLADLLKIEKERGYKPGWAVMRHKMRQNKRSYHVDF